MVKITKKLIKEIIHLDNLTLQDIDILKRYIELGLHKLTTNNSGLFYKAIEKYNQLKEAKK